MEISDSYEPDPWERTGKNLFWANSFVAGGAATAAFFRKKRAYVGNPSAGESVGVQVEGAVEAEIPAALRISNKVMALFTHIAAGTEIAEQWRLGNEIEYQDLIHPFSFLRSIPRDKIQEIYRSWSILIKKPFILGGIERGMEREWNNLEPHLSHFARLMHKDETQIRPLIRARNWDRLVLYLFDIPS